MQSQEGILMACLKQRNSSSCEMLLDNDSLQKEEQERQTSQTNVPTLKIKDLSRKKKIACTIYVNFQVHKYSTHACRSSLDMQIA